MLSTYIRHESCRASSQYLANWNWSKQTVQPCTSGIVLLIKVKRPFQGYSTSTPHYLVILTTIYLWLSTQICYTSTSFQISPYPVRSKFWLNEIIPRCCDFKFHLISVEYFNSWKQTFCWKIVYVTWTSFTDF